MNLEKYKQGFKPKQTSKRQIKISYIFVIVILFFYIFGFICFSNTIIHTPEFPDTQTDAIITLTGETKRITDAIAEFSKGMSKKLFISGIHRETPIKILINKTIDSLNTNKNIINNIDTGKAENTIENALESAKWVKDNNIKSIRVMTSDYHMHRSKLLFEYFLPNTVKIYHPINSPKNLLTFRLLFSEYNKYIITYIWINSGLEKK